MRCLQCGKRLSFLRKLSESEFCCSAHREQYRKQHNDLALAWLAECATRQGEPPARTAAGAIPAVAGHLAQPARPAPFRWRVAAGSGGLYGTATAGAVRRECGLARPGLPLATGLALEAAAAQPCAGTQARRDVRAGFAAIAAQTAFKPSPPCQLLARLRVEIRPARVGPAAAPGTLNRGLPPPAMVRPEAGTGGRSRMRLRTVLRVGWPPAAPTVPPPLEGPAPLTPLPIPGPHPTPRTPAMTACWDAAGPPALARTRLDGAAPLSLAPGGVLPGPGYPEALRGGGLATPAPAILEPAGTPPPPIRLNLAPVRRALAPRAAPAPCPPPRAPAMASGWIGGTSPPRRAVIRPAGAARPSLPACSALPGPAYPEAGRGGGGLRFPPPAMVEPAGTPPPPIRLHLLPVRAGPAPLAAPAPCPPPRAPAMACGWIGGTSPPRRAVIRPAGSTGSALAVCSALPGPAYPEAGCGGRLEFAPPSMVDPAGASPPRVRLNLTSAVRPVLAPLAAPAPCPPPRAPAMACGWIEGIPPPRRAGIRMTGAAGSTLAVCATLPGALPRAAGLAGGGPPRPIPAAVTPHEISRPHLRLRPPGTGLPAAASLPCAAAPAGARLPVPASRWGGSCGGELNLFVYQRHDPAPPVLRRAPPAPRLGHAPGVRSNRRDPPLGGPASLRPAGCAACHQAPAAAAAPRLRIVPEWRAMVQAEAGAEQCVWLPPQLHRQIQPAATRPVRCPAVNALHVPSGGLWLCGPGHGLPAHGSLRLDLRGTRLPLAWLHPGTPAPGRFRRLRARWRWAASLAAACAILAGTYSFVAKPSKGRTGPAAVNVVRNREPRGSGRILDAVAQRAAVRHFDDFRTGLGAWQGVEGWSRTWSYSVSTLLEPGLPAVYVPTLKMRDYSMEFLGQIERRSLSWAVRAQDPSNFYALRIVVTRGGAAPTGVLQRYPVVAGRQGAVQTMPLPPNVSLEPGRPLRIRTDVAGTRFTVRLQGQVVDTFTLGSHPRGGIGFFCPKGDRALLRWVEVMHQHDFLGRICALFAPGGQPAGEGR